jgi:hypothetical protein
LTYISEINYTDGFDKIMEFEVAAANGDLKREALITSALLSPVDQALIAELNKVIANPTNDNLRALGEIFAEHWIYDNNIRRDLAGVDDEGWKN